MHVVEIHLAGVKIILSTKRHDISELLRYNYEFFLDTQAHEREIEISDESMERYKELAGGGDWLWNAWNTYLISEMQERTADKLMFLHGSCVITGSGDCSVFLGRTMSGKTTLFLTAIEKGFPVLSDDIIVIDNETNTVHPFIKPVTVRKWLRNYINRYLPSLAGRLRPFVIPGTETQIPEEGSYLDVRHIKPHAAGPTPLGRLFFLANERDTGIRQKLGEIIATPGANHSGLLPRLLKIFNNFKVREIRAPTLFNYDEKELFDTVIALLS